MAEPLYHDPGGVVTNSDLFLKQLLPRYAFLSSFSPYFDSHRLHTTSHHEAIPPSRPPYSQPRPPTRPHEHFSPFLSPISQSSFSFIQSFLPLSSACSTTSLYSSNAFSPQQKRRGEEDRQFFTSFRFLDLLNSSSSRNLLHS